MAPVQPKNKTQAPAAVERVRPARPAQQEAGDETADTGEDDPASEELEGDDAAADEQGDTSTEESEDAGSQEAEDGQTAAKPPAQSPQQAGFARRAGRTSTAPQKKPSTMARPYLDTPRPFGIHIEGHLVRFKPGRTPITDAYFKAHSLTAAQVLAALKADSYVADNGAEVVE